MSAIIQWIVLLAFICQHTIFTQEVENIGVSEEELQQQENEIFGKLIEKDDGPFEKKVKKLVAEFVVATAAESTHLATGRAGGKRPPRTRRPGHHHHGSSEEVTTVLPAQPVYIQQPVYQQPIYQQPNYNPQYPPQYQPQPAYQPAYPPNSAPIYQPAYQPGYPPLTAPAYQPAYQPAPVQPQAQIPASQPTQNLNTSVDTPNSDINSGSQLPGETTATAPPTPAPIQQQTLPQAPTQQQLPSAPLPPQSPPAPVYQPAPVPPQSPPVPVYQPAPVYPQQPIQQPIQVVYLPATTLKPTVPTIPTTPRSTPSPEHVYNQVNKILDNVGTGNITGIVDQALGIRAPMPVRNFVNGILNTVFCNPINRLLGRCRG